MYRNLSSPSVALSSTSALALSLTFTLFLAFPTSACGQQTVGKDKVFLRITNLRSDQSRILIRINPVPNHDMLLGPKSNWNGKIFFAGRVGESDDKVPAADWLAPRESTPWIDIGRYMNQQGTRSPVIYLSSVLCGIMTSPQADGIDVLAEVATGAGAGVLRRMEIHRPDVKARGEWSYPWNLGCGVWNSGGGPVMPTLGLMIPTRPDLTGRVYTLDEALRAQLEEIANMPESGRVPEQFVFVARGRPEVLKGLGYHGYPADTVENNLGDEIGLSIAMKPEEQDQCFRDAMQSRGFDPLDFIPDEEQTKAMVIPAGQRWGLVHVLAAPKMDEKGQPIKPAWVMPAPATRPKAFYEAEIFRYRLWYEELAAQTRKAEKEHAGKRVLSGANYSPHMNVWPDVRQWIDPFRANAMTMSWTEDWWWQLPEVSPQGYGFLLDGLRLASTYHGAPIQFYVMPFDGQSPDNLRRMSAAGMAHGVKIFNHFVIEDQTLITWDYVDWTLSATMFPAIHDTIRDAGAVEKRLYPAMPVRSEVAILLSRAADTWDTEDLGGAGHLYGARFNMNNEERKSLWLSLRHAQYAVDLISDQDVAEGKLKGYKALYVVGSELLSAAARPLKDWVREGGTLYGTGGAGLLDEYHQKQNDLYEVYGIKSHELLRQTREIRPRRDLPHAKLLDTLRLEKSELAGEQVTLPALYYQETMEATGGGASGGGSATVIGKYTRNGKAGAVMNRFGKGRAILIGVLGGLAYVAPAAVGKVGDMPTDYAGAIRAVLVAPAKLAGAARPVTTSNPLVEAQMMQGPNGKVVVLTNWSPAPIANLTVRFAGDETVTKVRSLRGAGYFKGSLDDQQRGILEVKTVGGQPQVQMRLELTDYLLVN